VNVRCSVYLLVCFEQEPSWGEGSRETMSERQNTLVCAFDPQSPRITAYDIHERIFDTMCRQENEVALAQIDGPRRHVYIKLRDYHRMRDILTSNNGQEEFRHTNGEISKARIEAGGFGHEASGNSKSTDRKAL